MSLCNNPASSAELEGSPQVGTTPRGPAAMLPSERCGGGGRPYVVMGPETRRVWMHTPLGCGPELRKKIQRNPGWQVSSPDGREKDTLISGSKTNTEKSLLPAHSRYVGTCRRRETYSPCWKGEDEKTDGH